MPDAAVPDRARPSPTRVDPGRATAAPRNRAELQLTIDGREVPHAEVRA